MISDQFDDVAHVIRDSMFARLAVRAGSILHHAAAGSMAGRLIKGLRRQLSDVSNEQLLRIVGGIVLIGTLTQGALLQMEPSLVRPAAPGLLRVEILLAALVLIIGAQPIARAWPGSRLRRFLVLTSLRYSRG